jgi:hypothetical protein
MKVRKAEIEEILGDSRNTFMLVVAYTAILEFDRSDLLYMQKEVSTQVQTIWARLSGATMQLYETSYPSNLFKNLTKCRELAKEMMKPSALLAQS